MKIDNYEIPYTLIKGKNKGKTLCITAGIHAGEYPGIVACGKLVQLINPDLLTGDVMIFHCVNTSGFKKLSRAVVPEDGFNLNGHYPGCGDGIGSKIAKYFIEQVFPNIDYLIDLHSGGNEEPLTSCLFYQNGPVIEESKALALALNVPKMIQSNSIVGEYSYASKYFNIPSLLLEAGHSGTCENEYVEEHLTNLMLVMQYLNMYDFNITQKDMDRKFYTNSIYLECEEDGLWFPLVKENEYVTKGQLLGYTTDFYLNKLNEYYASIDGVVYYYTSRLAINKNDPLVAYGN